MAFPGPYASIIRNEEGEPIGWDNHYPGEYDPPDEDDMYMQDRDEEEVWCDECDSYHYEDEDCQEEDIQLKEQHPHAL